MSFAARGRAFEKTVQRALERHGFSLRLTAAGPDGGIDLKGEWILGPSSHASSSTGLHASHGTQARRVSCAVQCKFQEDAVSVGVVREFVSVKTGYQGVQLGLVASATLLSREAMALVRTSPVALGVVQVDPASGALLNLSLNAAAQRAGNPVRLLLDHLGSWASCNTVRVCAVCVCAVCHSAHECVHVCALRRVGMCECAYQ